MHPLVVALIASAASSAVGAGLQSMQPGPAGELDRGRQGQPAMPPPVPEIGPQQEGQGGTDWKRLLEMIVQQSMPPQYAYLTQLSNPAFWQQTLNQQSLGGGY